MPSSGFLSSKQHLIPCNKVFPIKAQENEKATAASDHVYDSDLSEEDTPLVTGIRKRNDSSCSDSCDSIVVPMKETLSQQQAIPAQSSRPVRNRRPPQFYGSMRDIDAIPTQSSSDDLIDSWYPGWDRDRTRNYINNGQQEL